MSALAPSGALPGEDRQIRLKAGFLGSPFRGVLTSMGSRWVDRSARRSREVVSGRRGTYAVFSGSVHRLVDICRLRAMRRTNAAVAVMSAMMDDPSAQYWGYDLTKRAGVRSGVLYPILHRMLDEGWLRDGWEDSADAGGRPPRRYYELTGEGIAHFRSELAEARFDPRFAGTLGVVG